MNKKELVGAIAAESGLNLKDAAKAVRAMTGVIAKSLHAGEEVVLPGFGSFTVRERAARRGRNPRTGEAVGIAARKVVYFKPGKELCLMEDK